MHGFDILIIGVAAVFFIIGIKNGFIEEIFHFAALIGGFFGAYFSYPYIYPRLAFLQKTSPVKTIISFVLAYVIIAFSLIIIGWLLKKLVHFSLLGWVDRLLGGVLGLGKAALIIYIFVLSVSLLPHSPKKTAYTDSATYKIFARAPFELTAPDAKKLRKYYHEVKQVRPVKKAGEKTSAGKKKTGSP